MATLRISPLAVLRHCDFRLLWISQLISIAGSQMRIVAVNWHVYALAKADGRMDPALALGLIGLARVFALVFSAPLSGPMADRVDRKRTLIVTSLVALLTSLVLGLATTFGAVNIWLIYTMVIGASVASAFEMPARQALLPRLVPAEILPRALSINIIAWQLATIVGPAIAGILLARIGVAPLYLLDAASFVAVVVAALMMGQYDVPSVAKRGPVLRDALDGLRFVFGSPMILSTMLLDFFATFFGAATTLMPIFADQILGVGPQGLGLLYAAPAVGAVIAAAVCSSITFRRQGPVLLWAVAIFGVCTAIFGVSRSLPLTLLALAGGGAADTVSMVVRGTIRQLLTPDALRGRMVAVNMVFFAGGPQLGEFESGVLGSLIGVPYAVLIGGLACIGFVGYTAWRHPELRAYDGPDAPAQML